MLKYIAKRVLVTIPVLIGVVFMIFVMLSVVPGDPLTVMMGEKVKVDVIERLSVTMHLNDPWYVRFVWYLWDALHGDFGTSYKLTRSVSSLIANAFPKTLMLAASAAVLSWLVGIPAGIISAVKKNSLVDHLFMGFALCGVSIPAFSVGMFLQNLFNGILPVSGFASPAHLILPALVLGWNAAGTIARLTRSSLLEVLEDDYIRTARAKGLAPLPVILWHGLKNSLLPVITMMDGGCHQWQGHAPLAGNRDFYHRGDHHGKLNRGYFVLCGGSQNTGGGRKIIWRDLNRRLPWQPGWPWTL